MAEGTCVFCRIGRRELPASVVHEDPFTVAFLDIRPINEGHSLVIPRAHAAGLADLDPATGGRLFETAMRVAAALRGSGVRCEGVNIHLADGEAAGQEVFHVHLHVFPRYEGDGFHLRFPPRYADPPDRSTLEATAARLREAIGRA